MKEIIVIIAMTGLFSTPALSQTSDAYVSWIHRAGELFNEKKYAASAASYEEAFALLQGKAKSADRYNAACAYAMAGNKDSAFAHLTRLATSNYTNYPHISMDKDLAALHTDSRWEPLLSQIKSNKELAEAKFIKPVVALLDKIYIDDQRFRSDINQLIQDSGMESSVVKHQLNLMDSVDKINQDHISKILDEYGWLGYDQVGTRGATTIFMVIQHSPPNMQKKYVGLMKAAVAKKQAMAGNLAMLEDRIAAYEGRKQVYGTQLTYDKDSKKQVVWDLEDPDNVDARRASVGLPSMSVYLKTMGMEWNLEDFKKMQKKN